MIQHIFDQFVKMMEDIVPEIMIFIESPSLVLVNAISQACEFDYSGTQGCKALKSEGYEIILINSNPATIMTDRK